MRRASPAAGPIRPARPALSFTAATLKRALPADVIQRGLISFDQAGQPRVASYDPSLLAPNPQRGRMVDRHIETHAESLNTFGQQEMIVARLITDTDRNSSMTILLVQSVKLHPVPARC